MSVLISNIDSEIGTYGLFASGDATVHGFKSLLSQHGVTVELTARDAPGRLLNASADMQDDTIQQYRERLLHMMPPARRISLMAQAQEALICEQCRRTLQTDLDSHINSPSPHYSTCECGELYQVIRGDQRAHPRLPVSLPGVYFGEGESQRMGEMVVEDLSYGGVRIRPLASHTLAHGDRFLVNFTLDDATKTVVSEPVIARNVQDEIIGAQFVDTSTLNHALALYLGISWIKASS